MSCWHDIDEVQNALEWYKVTGANINRDKYSGLRLGDWKGVPLSGPFSLNVGSVRILVELFVPSLQLKKYWSEVLAKFGEMVWI